jgi:hypothetical protein
MSDVVFWVWRHVVLVINNVSEELVAFLFNFIITIIIIISCHRLYFFPGASTLEPVVNRTTQASSLSL